MAAAGGQCQAPGGEYLRVRTGGQRRQALSAAVRHVELPTEHRKVSRHIFDDIIYK